MVFLRPDKKIPSFVRGFFYILTLISLRAGGQAKSGMDEQSYFVLKFVEKRNFFDTKNLAMTIKPNVIIGY